jgi:hypothetical protein
VAHPLVRTRITGTNGKTTTARMLPHIHSVNGWAIAITCGNGVYIDGKRVMTGGCTGPRKDSPAPILSAEGTSVSRGSLRAARKEETHIGRQC